MQITAAMVKELRERSGAGMMECKKALVETDGDIEGAYDHLRKSGAARAAKKAGRIAADGAVVVAKNANTAIIAEINSETDFVAKDENFMRFVDAVANTILNQRPTDVAALSELTLAGSEGNVENARTRLISKIGENISIRRFDIIESKDQAILATYLHGKRIGVLVELNGGDETLAKDVAMHIAASNPQCVSADDLPQALLDKERAIEVAKAEQSGKPPEIIEKMVTGRMRKFVNEITLEGQAFVKNPDISVAKLLSEANAKCQRFVRYEVGDGIEKKQENFADEVKAQVQKADSSA